MSHVQINIGVEDRSGEEPEGQAKWGVRSQGDESRRDVGPAGEEASPIIEPIEVRLGGEVEDEGGMEVKGSRVELHHVDKAEEAAVDIGGQGRGVVGQDGGAKGTELRQEQPRVSWLGRTGAIPEGSTAAIGQQGSRTVDGRHHRRSARGRKATGGRANPGPSVEMPAEHVVGGTEARMWVEIDDGTGVREAVREEA